MPLVRVRGGRDYFLPECKGFFWAGVHGSDKPDDDQREGGPLVFHTPAHVKDEFGGLTMQSSVNYLVLRIEKGFKKKSRYFTELLDLVT